MDSMDYMEYPPTPWGHQASENLFLPLLLSSPWGGKLDTPPHAPNSLKPRSDLILQPFFDAAFWAPVSHKWCPKVSIVRIWEPNRFHLGSHFGPFLGPGCKSEN